jgi:hypothetical protein
MTNKGKLNDSKEKNQGSVQNYVGSYVKLIRLSDNTHLNAKLRLKNQKKEMDTNSTAKQKIEYEGCDDENVLIEKIFVDDEMNVVTLFMASKNYRFIR